jgi:hypothetical protein
MGIIGAGFKSPKHAVAMLSKRFPAVPDADVPLGTLPYITRQTVAYALSLVVSAVSYSRTCILTKGRAPMLYEKLYDELAKMTDDVFNEELLLLIRSYLYNTTATEVEPAAPASAAPRRAAAADGGGGDGAGRRRQRRRRRQGERRRRRQGERRRSPRRHGERRRSPRRQGERRRRRRWKPDIDAQAVAL